MKIAIVLPRFPYPLEKGDKLRAYHQIVELSHHNEVYLFAVSHRRVSPEELAAVEVHCKKVCIVTPPKWVSYKNVVRNYFCTKSLQLGYWDSQRARRACRAFIQEVQPDVIYSQMVRTMPLVARLDYPKVMDFQDALSMNTERRMEQARCLWRYILHFEFKMLRSTEYKAFRVFDRLTIISESDRDAIPHRRSDEVQIVRNGVDFDYFKPLDLPKQHDIVFCGNMQYRPNVDAATFLVREVMPLVWERHPGATVMLAGATPKNAVRNLASDRVIVTGSVDDIRPCYAQSRLFVAPMRLGSGLQNKLLEAMSMGIPCITTPLANEALGATDGQHLLLGSTAGELADRICALLDDNALRSRLADSALSFVRDRFSWQAVGSQLQTILHEAADRHL
ncbi:MAG: glycosyltransferase [Bacteroidales bacterium]|nr:glycosyltransferase [Bacteroidales bacterium]